jgi:hypothetical protein
MEDDIYNGFSCLLDLHPWEHTVVFTESSVLNRFKKAILRDEMVYDDPPERYLTDERLDADVKAPEDVAFGFGRRCY